MTPASTAERIARHRLFWDRRPSGRPLAGIRIAPAELPAVWRTATSRLLGTGRSVSPDELDPAADLAEYRHDRERHETTGQDFFWTAEPPPGIPWMEAMLGAVVRAGKDSLVAEPGPVDIASEEFGRLDPDNPWFRKYLEYIAVLSEDADGRWPVGQPILRGPLDILTALAGVEDTVYTMADAPEQTGRLLDRISDTFTQVIARQLDTAGPFHGGTGLGFYHLWCPGRGIWLQQDAVAYLSPDLYRRFQAARDRRILASQPYGLFHLHPASFFTGSFPEDLLAMPELDVLQVNRDTGGPGLQELLPHLLHVLEHKRLLLWGRYSEDELRWLTGQLPDRGLAFQLLASSPEEARTLLRALG